MTLPATLQRIVANSGFLTVADVAELRQLDRLRQLLVRCGNGRFLCAAQDVDHFCEIIRRDFDAHRPDCDYIRDVSLPAGDPAHRGDYRAHTFEGSYRPEPAPLPPKKHPGPFPDHCRVRDDSCDYGGVFDGFGVTSDADPGL